MGAGATPAGQSGHGVKVAKGPLAETAVASPEASHAAVPIVMEDRIVIIIIGEE